MEYRIISGSSIATEGNCSHYVHVSYCISDNKYLTINRIKFQWKYTAVDITKASIPI